MLDALTLDQIRTFVAVAEAGSFRAGANRVSRVQSSVSHAIANLEAELRIPLFDRSRQRPRLTPEGEALLEDARTILRKVDIMRARARGLSEGREMEVRIAVDVLFPLSIVAEALHAVHTEHPTVRLRVEGTPLGAPLTMLRDGRCALGITVGDDLRDPSLERDALSSLSFVAVASPRHPLARLASMRISTAELADHVQIVLRDPSAFTEGRDFGVLSPRTWRVGGQDIKLALILAGIGWGRLPLWLVARELAEKRLIQLPVAALGPRGETILNAYLVRRMDEPLRPVAKAFREALLRNMRDTRAWLAGPQGEAQAAD